MDAIEVLNAIANDEDVREGCAPGYHDIDLSKFFDDARNVCFLYQSEYSGAWQGALLFRYKIYDIYEGHYLCTATLRGKEALQFVKRSLKTMFLEYGASAIVGDTPRDNRAARAMNRALGARPIGKSTDSLGRACISYVLERKKWATSSAMA